LTHMIDISEFQDC